MSVVKFATYGIGLNVNHKVSFIPRKDEFIHLDSKTWIVIEVVHTPDKNKIVCFVKHHQE